MSLSDPLPFRYLYGWDVALRHIPSFRVLYKREGDFCLLCSNFFVAFPASRERHPPFYFFTIMRGTSSTSYCYHLTAGTFRAALPASAGALSYHLLSPVDLWPASAPVFYTETSMRGHPYSDVLAKTPQAIPNDLLRAFIRTLIPLPL